MSPSLLDARRHHQTQLLATGPSSQPHAPLGATLPAATPCAYLSGGRSLAGLYQPPLGAVPSPRPALLYLHGGWALADAHLRECQPFIDAGYAVFAPSYRGENGNPGPHEMCWGELDDAHAALTWLGARPEVDKQRVFVFGHSAGGMLALLMSFTPELAAHLCGSVAGIYGPEVFDHQLLPFVDTPGERALRLGLPHLHELEQPHVAFVGSEDAIALAAARVAVDRAREAGVPLEVIVVAGDHQGAVEPAMRAFLTCAAQVS